MLTTEKTDIPLPADLATEIEEWRAFVEGLYGTGEAWLPIPGWEGYYDASTWGRIPMPWRRACSGAVHVGGAW